jgi:FXSXX-COOH protein
METPSAPVAIDDRRWCRYRDTTAPMGVPLAVHLTVIMSAPNAAVGRSSRALDNQETTVGEAHHGSVARQSGQTGQAVASGMNTNEESLRSDLVDLTGLDFDELDALPASVFVTSLERLQRRTDAFAGQYAGFESFLDVDR